MATPRRSTGSSGASGSAPSSSSSGPRAPRTSTAPQEPHNSSSMTTSSSEDVQGKSSRQGDLDEELVESELSLGQAQPRSSSHGRDGGEAEAEDGPSSRKKARQSAVGAETTSSASTSASSSSVKQGRPSRSSGPRSSNAPRPSSMDNKDKQQARDADTGGSSKSASSAILPRKSTAFADVSEAAASSSNTGGARDDEIRLRRLDEALDRFLDLVDVRATPENFASVLSQIPTESLEPVRQKLVADLKDTVKEKHAELIREYELDDRLRQLQRLAVDADARAARRLPPDHEDMKDVWRPDLDITTALHARAVPAQRDRVAKLEAELAEVEASNARMHAELKANMTESDDRQAQICDMLEAMQHAMEQLQPSPAVEKQMRNSLEALADELGPRA